ncbi:ATP-binding cassette domain-containing protein [Shouchella sp. 1P09AA]|uniref:ATP-binding cassette domain-containing protein n=1 Tax=unclassified Shouchella TaxID=2893065 RepID=UPI0039A32E5C
MKHIQVNELTVGQRNRFKKEKLLQDLTFTVRHGENVSIFGRNKKAEQEALIDCLIGMKKPVSGEITIGKHTMTSLNDEEAAYVRRNEIGIISSRVPLIQEYSVERNLNINNLISKKQKGVQEELMPLFHSFNVENMLKEKVQNLTSAEQETVRIIRALLVKPSILMMEIPGNIEGLQKLIHYAWGRQLTFLYTTEDWAQAKLAHGVLHLKDGQLHEG